MSNLIRWTNDPKANGDKGPWIYRISLIDQSLNAVGCAASIKQANEIIKFHNEEQGIKVSN